MFTLVWNSGIFMCLNYGCCPCNAGKFQHCLVRWSRTSLGDRAFNYRVEEAGQRRAVVIDNTEGKINYTKIREVKWVWNTSIKWSQSNLSGWTCAPLPRGRSGRATCCYKDNKKNKNNINQTKLREVENLLSSSIKWYNTK